MAALHRKYSPLAIRLNPGVIVMQVIFMQVYRWLILRALRRVRARDWEAEDTTMTGKDKEN